jgi:hypothetical protein
MSGPRGNALSAPERMLAPMAPSEQLEYESRAAQRAGIAAVAAGALVLLSTFYPAIFGSKLGSARDFDKLIVLNDNPADALIPSVLQAIAYPLAGMALIYMYRATRARRPETLRITYVLALVGPIAVAIASLLYGFALVDLASKVADSGVPNGVTSGGVGDLAGVWSVGEERAHDLTSGSGLFTATAILDLAANLAYGFGLVLIGLNAMRAGLVSRFIGILGVVAGVVTVLFRGSGPIEAFWLIAIGLLIMNRWPSGGRGPAWETGEATPWPTAMDRQRELIEARGGAVDAKPRRGFGRRAPEVDEPDAQDELGPDDDYEDEPIDPSEPAPKTHPVSKKRKRKRRG